MAVLEILKYPDKFLRTKAGQVASVDDGIRRLVSDMAETMYAAKGIGLAAPQVGVSKRVICLDVPKEGDPAGKGERQRDIVALINPVIIESGGEIKYEEGCLSLPGVTANVYRAETVKVKALSLNGAEVTIDANGLFAIALQHEIDHLDGILFIDRLSRLKREFIKRRLKKAMEEKASPAL
jgi:peptide deformylase